AVDSARLSALRVARARGSRDAGVRERGRAYFRARVTTAVPASIAPPARPDTPSSRLEPDLAGARASTAPPPPLRRRASCPASAAPASARTSFMIGKDSSFKSNSGDFSMTQSLCTRALAALSLLLVAAGASAERYPEGYADDRAAIVDLQARYV